MRTTLDLGQFPLDLLPHIRVTAVFKTADGHNFYDAPFYHQVNYHFEYAGSETNYRVYLHIDAAAFFGNEGYGGDPDQAFPLWMKLIVSVGNKEVKDAIRVNKT